MNIHQPGSRWSTMTDDERKQFLNMLTQFDKMVRAFRDMVRRVVSTDSEDSDPAWQQAELMDVYQQEVKRNLGRPESELWEGGAEVDDDSVDRFSQHCQGDYRRGSAANDCARQWRCRPG
jgi:hypothetical protein